MKAQELRIGNYVLDSGGKVLRIDFFEHLQSGYDCKFGQRMFLASEEVHPMTDYTNSAKPIPLTEQWLIDFGFEKKSWFTKGIVIECVYYQLADLIVYLVDDFFEIEVVTKAGQFNLFKKWNHVHQLQNIYFALTGEELQL